VHLSGHVHEPNSEQILSGAGGHFVRVAAGAAHRDRPSPGSPPEHGYNVAAVVRGDGGSLRLRVWPRRWSNKNKEF
ncbi:hypothetical protein ACQ7B2_00695, partial [Escherichia coli]